MVSRFQILQTLGKKKISVNFSAKSIAQMLQIIKKYISKKYHVFHAPDNSPNQKVNFDVISKVMKLRVKVKTVCSFKKPYFHE